MLGRIFEIEPKLSSLQSICSFTISQQSVQLAPSTPIAAFLTRKDLLNTANMALTTIKALSDKVSYRPEDKAFSAPPEVVTTPCDPWPRPYYLEDGLRKVHPYHYTYNTYCKERWRGRELLDIFTDEFRDRPKEYYVRAAQTQDSVLALS